jgi:hypothetical protein
MTLQTLACGAPFQEREHLIFLGIITPISIMDDLSYVFIRLHEDLILDLHPSVAAAFLL